MPAPPSPAPQSANVGAQRMIPAVRGKAVAAVQSQKRCGDFDEAVCDIPGMVTPANDGCGLMGARKRGAAGL